MNDELIKREALIKRIDDAMSRGISALSPELGSILGDCRAALTKKYAPMTGYELSDIYFSAEQDDLDGFAAIQTAVIRRAGLEVEK